MVAGYVAVVEGVGECACEAGFCTEHDVLVLRGRHGAADQVDAAELGAEYEEPAGVCTFHQTGSRKGIGLNGYFLCCNVGLTCGAGYEEERQGMGYEQ